MGKTRMVKMKRYRNLKSFLIENFGCRVHKVTIDAGFTCPNRDGTVGYGGCIYCDERGSGSYAIDRLEPVRKQVSDGIERLKKRYKAEKFIAYFQAFTNTYAPVERLKRLYDEALEHPDIVGLAIGTRPDCVPDSVHELVESYVDNYQVWLEYGLQSCHNDTLMRINRGHKYEDFVDAVERTRGRGILICAHVIIGLPGESREDILATAEAVAQLQLDAIKIHSLYVLEGTSIAKMYHRGEVPMIERDEYVELLCDFLERLPPNMVIQRLIGEGPRDRLIAPKWCLDKHAVLSQIDHGLEKRDSYQGKLWKGRTISTQDAAREQNKIVSPESIVAS